MVVVAALAIGATVVSAAPRRDIGTSSLESAITSPQHDRRGPTGATRR
jgi:hypothetical protein